MPERREDPLGFFTETAQTYGDVVRYRMGPRVAHLIRHPDHLKYVLQENQKNYRKGFGFDQLRPVLGSGLLTSAGDFWRRQRKLSQPAFHRQHIAAMADTMVRATERMLARWEKEHGSKPFDVAVEMMRLALGIAGETLFSIDVTDAAEQVGEAMTCVSEEVNHRMLSVVHLMEKLPTPRNFRFKRAIKDLDEVVYRIIDERRRNPGAAEKHKDLLSMYMSTRDEETGEGMTDSQLRDEVMTLFLAGHETTANSLAWTWYLLGQHPEADRRFEQELRTVLGGRAPTFEDLPKLVYTNALIEESMRIYPPVWVLVRQANEADTIGGYEIPKDSIVILSPYVTHRHPEFWENPEGFDPDRFLNASTPARLRPGYMPFGGGPRFCIGNQFALTEAALVLATVRQRVRLELEPGRAVVPEALVTLRPKNAYVRMKR